MKIQPKSNHKGIAPIIATLLMVAIAVTGGILVFVFTQGFFSEEQVVGPAFDNLEIFGYNAEDEIGSEAAHEGSDIDCAGADPGNTMTDGDCLLIFVTNKGDKVATIDKVRVFGDTYSQAAGSTATCTTSAKSFSILSCDLENTAIINPNFDATICVVYENDDTGDVKIGRTIPVQLQSGNGQVSQINIVNGALRGQTSSSSAACDGGDGGGGEEEEGSTAPGAPTSLSAVTTSTSSVDLSWTAPGDDGGEDITDYIVEFKESSSEIWLTFSDGASTDTTATVTDLDADTEYDFRVSAKNSVDTGVPSNEDSATTDSVSTAPGKPTGLSGDPVFTVVLLEWSAPVDDGGEAITDYIIEFKLSSDSEWTTFDDGTSTDQSALVTGLDEGTEYNFRVSAVNSIDTGNPSDPITVTTLDSSTQFGVICHQPPNNSLEINNLSQQNAHFPGHGDDTIGECVV